jgi:hypothetical protein
MPEDGRQVVYGGDACGYITLLDAGPPAGQQTPKGQRGRPILDRDLQGLFGTHLCGLGLTTKLSQLRGE